MDFPSSPTGNGETRGMEYAGQPGEPLSLRPARAIMNDANSYGSHDMDSEMAADGRVDMQDDGHPTRIPVVVPRMQDLTNSKSGTGDPYMGSKVIMKGKMNR